mmetsp:Transcript_17678/g.27958  ORF Transcript_17678/g.27958 Transcript_17678/m.27958 type:complete len:85 (-) Transcript_17678:52-306(-)
MQQCSASMSHLLLFFAAFVVFQTHLVTSPVKQVLVSHDKVSQDQLAVGVQARCAAVKVPLVGFCAQGGVGIGSAMAPSLAKPEI